MPHTEFAPQSALKPNIACFWTLEADQLAYNQHPILPDSYLELVINCGAPLLLEADGKQINLPIVMLTRLQQTPLKLRATGDVHLIGVRLYAWQNRIDLPQSASPIIGLDGIWNDFAQTLQTTFHRKGQAEAVQTLQQFVNALPHHPNPDLSIIQKAGEQLYRTNGKVRMSELIAHAHLSPRQFERRFKHFTGFSPKTLARLIRFESIRNAWVMNPSIPPTVLAHDFGYTDQAHFIHDFKSLAAQTPGTFAADGPGRWAELSFPLYRPRPRDE